MRIFDDTFDMHQGYVLNFSERTMAEFFEDEFGIEIYQEKYRINGSSKAKHLRASPYGVARSAAERLLAELTRLLSGRPESDAILERLSGIASAKFTEMDSSIGQKRDRRDAEALANRPAGPHRRWHAYSANAALRLLL